MKFANKLFTAFGLLVLAICIMTPMVSATDPAPISFSGVGQEASQKFTLDEGLSIFAMKHSGSSNFIVWLLDSNGNNVDLLVNEVGAFDGSKATGIKYSGIYCLNIAADGNWKIDVSQ